MLKTALITNLFKGFTIQRWNDKIRPVVLTEIDKNAHKMIIAYCLAKYEDKAKPIDWENLIKGGIYEYLKRVTISDIKSTVYRKIQNNKKAYTSLNKWVLSKWRHILSDSAKDEFNEFLTTEETFIEPRNARILKAAHIYASYWEFRIIKQANPEGYQIKEIDNLIKEDILEYIDLIGIKKLLTKQIPTDFIDLAGQLRFQIRWSQTPRVPETSVLGHSMYVAILAYLLSKSIGACTKRTVNNFFGGLFHDLPEALTRDIISPVKRASAEMPVLIKRIEAELAETELYKTVDDDWKKEIHYFITDDDQSKIMEKGKIQYKTSDEISASYNANEHNPIDGEIVKAADQLAAFIEAWYANVTGIHTEELINGLVSLRESNKDKIVAGIDFSAIYEDFPIRG